MHLGKAASDHSPGSGRAGGRIRGNRFSEMTFSGRAIPVVGHGTEAFWRAWARWDIAILACSHSYLLLVNQVLLREMLCFSFKLKKGRREDALGKTYDSWRLGGVSSISQMGFIYRVSNY